MIRFLNKLFGRGVRRKEAGAGRLLRGAPARERWKNYAAETGFVHQYVFRGYEDEGPFRNFVFEIRIPGGKRLKSIGVPAKTGERQLLDPERYAVAKLALFGLFDASDESQEQLTVGAEETAEFLRTLGRFDE